MTLEEKIRKKAKSSLKGFITRADDANSPSEGNIETYLRGITGAMSKIIKTEVNIRLQEERHKTNKACGREHAE